MGLKAVANPAAGGQPGSFTTLTVSGAATIGGGLAVTGSISATGQIVVADGSAATPSFRFSTSPTGGFYRVGSAIGISENGVASGTLGSATGAGGLYLAALGTNQNVRIDTTGTGILDVRAPISATGSISATDYIAGAEQTPPSAPAANGYRIFAQDNGAGKTQLMVIFATGAAQQIAIEP